MRRALLIAAVVLCAAQPSAAQDVLTKIGERLRGLHDREAPAGWRLVAAYELSALMARAGHAPGWVWLPPPGMLDTCGPERRPTGLGVFEAEAVDGGLAPTLALVLEQPAGRAGLLDSDRVRVAVGRGKPEVTLQPMVMPRRLRVHIGAEDGAEPRMGQLLRTQIAIEGCLEHKVGRAWIGGETHLLREAFLLDPPGSFDGGDTPDRMYFGGQGAPVPALMGPPELCLEPSDDLPPPQPRARVVAGRRLVPSDVWDADLPLCGPGDRPAAEMLPLALSGGAQTALGSDRDWSRLELRIRGGPEPADVRVSATLDGAPLLDQGLFADPEKAAAVRAGGGGLVDVLAHLPRAYPQIGPPEDPRRFAVLLVPNWQIEDALRAVLPPRQGEGLPDAVGALLQHPELLFVQVQPEGARAGPWPDLSSVLGPGPLRARLWGRMTSVPQGPVVLARAVTPAPRLHQAAQRARPQAAMLLAAGFLLPALLLGLRRLAVLWRPQPSVPVDYWPGEAAVDAGGSEVDEAAQTATNMAGQ